MPTRFVDYLSRYLDHQVEAGRLRPHDTNISARAFIGTLVFHALSTRVVPMLSEDAPDDEGYVDGVVRIFLQGH